MKSEKCKYGFFEKMKSENVNIFVFGNIEKIEWDCHLNLDIIIETRYFFHEGITI